VRNVPFRPEADLGENASWHGLSIAASAGLPRNWITSDIIKFRRISREITDFRGISPKTETFRETPHSSMSRNFLGYRFSRKSRENHNVAGPSVKFPDYGCPPGATVETKVFAFAFSRKPSPPAQKYYENREMMANLSASCENRGLYAKTFFFCHVSIIFQWFSQYFPYEKRKPSRKAKPKPSCLNFSWEQQFCSCKQK
jgi:hypothetical protein